MAIEKIGVEAMLDRKSRYVVPRYQRGYSWTDENVRELLNDIREGYEESPSEEYLLGQIIVCPALEEIDQFETWDIIDGQQRLTTLYLILLNIFLKLQAAGSVSSTVRQNKLATLRSCLMAFSDEDTDETEPPARIRVASNGQILVEAWIHGKPAPEADSTPTQARLREAFEVIESFLTDNFVSGDASLWKFLDYVLRQVVLIRLELENADHALRVFLKVNNRGLTLDDSDLLKSLLFQRIRGEEDFKLMSKSWDSATEYLYKSRLKKTKSMEFLMKVLIGIRSGRSVTTTKVFQQWSDLLKTENDAKLFGQDLPTKARNLARITSNRLPVGQHTSTEINYGTSLLKVVQHFEALLAGDHLSEGAYLRVASIIEDRTMLSILAGEKGQDYERKVHGWANAISHLPTTPNSSEILDALNDLVADCEQLFTNLRSELPKLTYLKSSHHLKIRYVLARVAKTIQDPETGLTVPLSAYLQTTKRNSEDKGFDLDHLFPQAAGKRIHWKIAKLENGDDESQETIFQHINSIGNLVLLHPKDNRTLSDSLPWSENKRNCYLSSELVANNLLANRNLKTKMEWSPKGTIDLENWGSQAVKDRIEFLCDVLENSIRKNLST